MIYLAGVSIGVICAVGWAFSRQSEDADGVRRLPKLESFWFGLWVAATFCYLIARLIDPLIQSLNASDLWVMSFPFLILVVILLVFSMHFSRSRLFRQQGYQLHRWKIWLFSVIGGLFVTLPAVEVISRATDLSQAQTVETVVVDKTDNVLVALLSVGGTCAITVKNPFQDAERWQLRMPGEVCDKVHVNITPIKLNVRDGRFGIPYLESATI